MAKTDPYVDKGRPMASKPTGRPSARRQLSVDDYVEGVIQRDRVILARAITLIESNRPQHREMAQEVLQRLLPHTGRAHRLGITGVPGAGKSTFIESFGRLLTSRGHFVAVLAIDPSSTVTGGSILGDKTRMNRLANDPSAFVRPSPSAGTLGGVARKTRETMLVCEAAGYDVVMIETVGVGQSETVVARMVDFFLVLMIAGAGDELQGIKRGVLEMADMIAVNKADGDNVMKAQRARRQYESALHFMRPASPNWTPPVETCSALENEGLEALWHHITEHRRKLSRSGELPAKRRRQMIEWMWSMVEDQLMSAFRNHPEVRSQLPRIEGEVKDGLLPPTKAARQILEVFGIQE